MNSGLKKVARHLETSLLRGKRKKDVLITVRNEIMFNNIRPVYERLRTDKRLRIWICLTFKDRFLSHNLQNLKRTCSRAQFVSYRLAEYLKWDLILCPEQTLNFRRDCPMIYTGHSLKSGKLNPSGDSMKYGAPSRRDDGSIKYTKIFCANEHEHLTVKEYFPEHLPLVRVVGNMLVDEVLAARATQRDILERLKLDPQRKTLLVTSTWRQDSLAQSQGLALLSQIDALVKKYNVIISFHQNNFVPEYSPDIDWRAELDKYHHPNLYILRNNESSLQYLPAADMMLTDHTSTSLYYLFLQRPIIYFVHPDVLYDKGALILELQRIAHSVGNIDALEEDIKQTLAKFDAARYEELAHKTCSHVGHAWEQIEEEIYDILNLSPLSVVTRNTEKEVLV